MDSSNSKPHVALVSSPGIGHLIPVLELRKRLVANHGFHVTVFSVTTTTAPPPPPPPKPKTATTTTTLDLVDIFELHVDISGLVNPNAPFVERVGVTMRESLPILRQAISGMDPRPTTLVVDIFGTDAMKIADEFDMSKYVFITTSAWVFAFCVFVPTLDEEVEGEYVDLQEPVKIPGCNPVRVEDLVDPMLDRRSQQYFEFLRTCKGYLSFDGVLVNTWEDLERPTLKAFRENGILKQVLKAPIYPIGPLVKRVGSSGSRSELLDWLDLQPCQSVLYVSFGSAGTVSAKQITELAWGLELSQQRFIWVLRPPMEKGGPHDLNDCDDVANYLPDGFLSRTHKLGLVVPTWAPQEEILGHRSVGGFLSHGGWNSSLESILSGVPMIMWPLYAEQKMNAAMVVEELEVGVRVVQLSEVVEREEIAKFVRMVIEGREGKAMRTRVKELQCSGERALIENGSSYESMCELARDFEMKLKY
ncbi:unnamed protein product [Camellia sinensis]